MRLGPLLACAPALAGLALALALDDGSASTVTSSGDPPVPSVDVPACPRTATIHYSKSVPDLGPFPPTSVSLCYTPSKLALGFVARGETNFYYNASQGTNDEIYNYEVMEAFIHRGTRAPQTYLEFEVNPINVTYQAFVYNPSKVRATGAPFDHFFITDPLTDGLSAHTVLHRDEHYWRSDVEIPLGLWNVDDGEGRGTQWRMNFFRTITSPSTYPNQTLGAWSPPDAANFHITPYMGHVTFV